MRHMPGRAAPLLWHRCAALLGASGVALGAYGTHGFKPSNPAFKEVWATANHYQLLHAALLAAAPLARRPAVVGGLAAVGTLLFSGSCYVAALAEDRTRAKLAPIG